MSKFSVNGRNAIVTGASQGIGRGIAKMLAEEGANVAICSRAQERVDPVAEEINEEGGTAFAMECNVRDTEEVQAFVDATVEEFGGLDLLVNNAGGAFTAPFEDLSENAWKSIVDLNLNGVRHCTYAAGEQMRENEGGDIINFSSLRAEIPSSDRTAYSASKKAIITFTENLAVEWAKYNISVNCISPGVIQTPGVADALGIDEGNVPSRDVVDRRLGQVEDITDVVHFLASPAASFMTGETISVKGTPRATGPVEEELGLVD